MSNDDDDDQPSTLAQRQLGRFLREKREGVGLTLQQAAQLVELSKTALQRLETASLKRKYRTNDVKALCEIYEVSAEETARAIELTEQAKTASWYTAFSGLFGDSKFNMFVGLEAVASRLIVYHEIVPGLLQTADYARALIVSFHRDDDPEDIDRRVELRLKRQVIVKRKARPVKLEVLLHESALYRVIGSRRIMRAQLAHLAEMGKLPNITLRIIPFGAGCAWGELHGPFVVLDFGVDNKGRIIEPQLVYVEGHGLMPDMYVEDKDAVERYHDLVSAIREMALNEQQSRDLLRRAARSYER
ncbi:helix-turn-helix domain-containing protein [Nocardia sp. CDC159]|uniref:Helix-turn-helix domain-containing protein n=1 Tax=Nocardia pulmonis TaxID=2951408 RepID=A0A9X2E5W0_9NOCA|nr:MULTISPECIES: helix-turn-helix transcriptional regulator [Nocardia]MCM6774809.1 helix-turn-helix domain-containing protein [Nocardia pulmonis]MCM6789740.1 helix-turn-helix domain-containing protein [Nocardia sp. CDC159]